jgi:hypothetical protein
MDEQGGGDMCVGNHGFVFERVEDIRAEAAIPLNWPDPNYRTGSGAVRWLSKFPTTGGFVPLAAKNKDGSAIRGAGTGILCSMGLTFNADRTSAEDDSDLVTEYISLKWDGQSLTVTDRTLSETLLGHRLLGNALSGFHLTEDGWLAPFTTDQGTVVYRFSFDGQGWRPTDCGRPCATYRADYAEMPHQVGESEPSLVRVGNRYLLYTRGKDPYGRLYHSTDGLNYELLVARPNHTIPQVLNQGLDGKAYLVTNPSLGWLRNPLVAYPMRDDATFGEPVVIHDQGGIRDDQGDSIPFVDHGVAANVHLEGRWRHFLWYRVCDLKERTPHSFQTELKKKLGQPKPRSQSSGLYLAEIEYDRATHVPYHW